VPAGRPVAADAAVVTWPAISPGQASRGSATPGLSSAAQSAAQAMAGFSVLDAWTGAGYDAWAGQLRIGLGAERYPLIAGTGWGEVTVADQSVSFRCLGGAVPLTSVSVPAAAIRSVRLAGRPETAQLTAGGLLATFAEPVTLADGDTLVVTLAS
jgi:hypothetical protein